MSQSKLINDTKSFATYLIGWVNSLPEKKIGEISIQPEKTAIVVVDVTNGFCKSGPLASSRGASIIPNVVDVIKGAWNFGIRQIILSQDSHEPDALEFNTWPVHCVRGTEEADSVDEIKNLPFYDELTIYPKNSLSSDIGTGFYRWRKSHDELDTYIIMGTCTDICVYELAVQLRVEADAHQLKRNVIIPANCVQTYDYPLEMAIEKGGLPHPGDLTHALFLYHSALNGVEVIDRVIF